MKRSDINEILGHTRQFFSMHDVHLPPFASFPPVCLMRRAMPKKSCTCAAAR